MNKLVILSAVGFAGCFSSLVSDPCAAGYQFERDACVLRVAPPDGGGGGSDGDGGSGSGCVEGHCGSDAGSDGGSDGGSGSGSGSGSGVDGGTVVDGGVVTPPDALVCTMPLTDCDGACVDTSTDPNNCGRCDHVCASGLCTNGLCAGDPVGHVVAIGHDYASYHAAMARVLGNAIALGRSQTVRVGWYRGSASAANDASARAAGAAGLAATGRPETVTALAALPAAAALASLDVVVVDPQHAEDGDALEADGVAEAAQLHAFLVAGGVVIVLEGATSNSYRFAKGAGLYDAGAPIAVTSQTAYVTVATDAVAQQVSSSYLAETTSAALATSDSAVVVVPNVGAVVVHRSVQ